MTIYAEGCKFRRLIASKLAPTKAGLRVCWSELARECTRECRKRRTRSDMDARLQRPIGPRTGLLLTAAHAFGQTGFPVGHRQTESALQLGICEHRITRPVRRQRVLLARDGF